MFHLLKTILVRACAQRRRGLTPALLAAGLALAGCGQKGPLFLPAGADAVGRASLPQTLIPGPTRGPVTSTAPASTASPAASPAAPSVNTPTPPEPRQ